MYVGAKRYDLTDSELGRFLRRFTEFELLLRTLVVAVEPDTTWNAAALYRISDLMNAWSDALPRFPSTDRAVMGRYLRTAEEVVSARHLLVHGRWFEVDPSRELFVVELPLTKTAARRFDPPSDWPRGAHPATVMPMNPATIARVWRMAGHLVDYFTTNLEAWEHHLLKFPPDLPA